MRCLFGANQGHRHHKTKEAANRALAALLANNSTERLAEFGHSFRVDCGEAYSHGDLKGIYFDDPEAPFDKQHASILKRVTT